MSKYVERFRVRQDECDAYGHLNNVVYLRYAQESAWGHSSAAGFDPSYYEDHQTVWLARDTEIEYRQPVSHRQSIEVMTYVRGYRRSWARRQYEFRVEGSGDLVASAHTDWIYFDRARGSPTSIPQELINRIFPHDPATEDLKRQPFPEPLPAPPGVFKIMHPVEWRDIDPYQHLNNAAYLAYVENCAIQLGSAFGWSAKRTLEAGYAFIARRIRIQYLELAGLGDELEISTWLTEIRHASVGRHYDLVRASDGELLAQVRIQYLAVDPATGRPRRFPPGMLEDYAANIAENAR